MAKAGLLQLKIRLTQRGKRALSDVELTKLLKCSGIVKLAT